MNKSEPKQRIWVVVPAFNEEKIIGEVLFSLTKEGYSVLVIDDCSTDTTKEIALSFPVVLLHHSINLGQGAALQTGFDYICSNTNADFIVTFDSDGQHNIEDIKSILYPVIRGTHDVALGSRFLNTSDKTLLVNGMPKLKLLTLKAGVLFTRLTLKLKLTDTHNGLRAFSIDALRKIKITQNRMAHASEILAQISKNKLSYCEVPININYTEYSKMKGQSILNSLNIIWDLFFGRNQ